MHVIDPAYDELVIILPRLMIVGNVHWAKVVPKINSVEASLPFCIIWFWLSLNILSLILNLSSNNTRRTNDLIETKFFLPSSLSYSFVLLDVWVGRDRGTQGKVKTFMPVA